MLFPSAPNPFKIPLFFFIKNKYYNKYTNISLKNKY